MTKKLLIFTFLLVGIVLFKGALSKPVLAATSGIAGVELDNTAGTIPITVYINFYHSGTSSAPGPQFDYRVVNSIPAGTSTWQYSSVDTPDSPYYWVSWSTSCSDPPVIATYAGTWGNDFDPGGSIAAYEAPTQDVHCTTPNATPSINYTACASVGWSLTGVGVNGANISYFEVYRSTNSGLMGDATTNPDPSTKMPGTLSASSRSVDWGSLAAGTYYVRVRAVSPQGVGSWSSVNSFTCGAAIAAASGLNANPSCNGSGAGNIVAVNFGWVAASGGSTEQWLDYSVYNNNFAGGTFNSQSVAVGATSFNFSTGFPQGVRFYWRVNNKIGGNWYPSVTANFLTPTCPVGATPTPTPSPTPTPGVVCPAGCTGPGNINDSWSEPNGYVSATGLSGNSGTCSGKGSCSIGFLTFVGGEPSGEPIGYTVYVSSSSGPVLKTGTTTANANGSASFSWSMTYEYVYCKVGSLLDTTCVSNPSVVITSTGTRESGSISNPDPNTFYHREAWAPQEGSSGTRVWNTTSKTAACDCPTPTPSPTPVPPRITVSYLTDCVDGVNPKVHLTWTSNTGATGYTVYRDSANVTAEGLPNPLGGSARAWNSTAAQPAGAHNWYVVGTGGSFPGTTSNTVSITTATCSPPPADPSNLVISSSCNAATGLPEITFRWQDNSNIEQGFWMDVSHDAFTGPSSTTVSPSVWGVKGITRSGAAETGAVGGTVQFLWNNAVTTNTVGQLDSGDVDSAVAGNQLAPERGVTYYWRVKAYSVDRQSNHVYPGGTDGVDADTIADGSTTPPGVAFTTPNCMFDLEVTNNPGGNTQVYDPGGTVSFRVQVTNRADTAQVAYPGGGNLGAWTQSNLPSPGPNCAGTAVTPAPNPPTNTIQSISIPTLGIGASTIITLVNFTAPSTPGSYIANFYALPTCAPNNDLNWTNNGFQLTYVVSAKAWFETTGGDVGARGSIQVSNTSIPAGHWQSTAVLAGNPLGSNVAGQWELNNYTSPIFPTNNTTKVYDYMNSRFAAKATTTGCSIGASPVIEHCAGDMSLGATNMTTAGSWIIFVDGNLNVTDNITVGSTTTLVFIVRNNITINTNVTQADGVYIAGGTFADYDNAGTKTRSAAPYWLVINGAVYAHAFDLSAFLSNQVGCAPAGVNPNYANPTTNTICNNSTTPTDYVIFQPKYLIILSQLIGSPSVSWQEVAP